MFVIYKYSEAEVKQLLKTAVVVIDSREKKCVHITDYFDEKGIKWITEKLDFGDITIKIESPAAQRDFYLQDYITIERKACLDELSGNFAHERERMEREFMRSRGRLILLIENANYDDLLEHRYSTKYSPKAFLATLKAFESRFGFETVFMKDSSYSGSYIYQTLIYHLRNLLLEGRI